MRSSRKMNGCSYVGFEVLIGSEGGAVVVGWDRQVDGVSDRHVVTVLRAKVSSALKMEAV
jgi:hypothetical protein